MYWSSFSKIRDSNCIRNILNYMDDIQLAEPSKPFKAIDSITIHGVENLPITFKKLNHNLIKI